MLVGFAIRTTGSAKLIATGTTLRLDDGLTRGAVESELWTGVSVSGMQE